MEIAAILIAVITLIASLSIPEIRQKLRFDPKSEQLSPLGHPLFRGHLRSPVDSKSFSDFLDKNIGGIVFIDVSIDEKDFVGQLEGDLQWFALSE